MLPNAIETKVYIFPNFLKISKNKFPKFFYEQTFWFHLINDFIHNFEQHEQIYFCLAVVFFIKTLTSLIAYFKNNCVYPT